MSIFNRLFTWGKSEAHAVMDKLEDPIKVAEQGIRDLRQDLSNSMQSLGQVKAQVIKAKRDLQHSKETAADYEQKAMLLLGKAQNGEMDVADAERLATEALGRRDGAIERGTVQMRELEKLNAMTGQMENNIQALRSNISKWENELKTLRARSQVSRATRKLNEQMAQVDPSGTISMLERMREKVATEESLAEAYGELARMDHSVDDEINAALSGGGRTSASLEDLKARMGVGGALPAPGEPARLPGK